MKPILYQVDFYPDGRIVYHYNNQGIDHHIHTHSSIKPKTPAESLQERLALYKKQKRKEN